jgi:type IV secretory pathway VirB2 component (pilin)
MKKLFLIPCLFLMLLFGNFAPSARAYLPEVVIPGIHVPGQSKAEFKICQIRRIFCGKTATVIIGISIFIIGVMLLNNRLTWPTAMLMIIGMIIFYRAEYIADSFGKLNNWSVTVNGAIPGGGNTFSSFYLNPTCSCACNLSIDWLNPVAWFNGDISCPIINWGDQQQL